MKYLLLVITQFVALTAFSQIREKMVYSAKYSFVKGGEAELIVEDTLYQGKALTCYEVRGQSVGMTKLFFDARYLYETILDDKNVIPYFHLRDVKENRYKFRNETTFYYNEDSICSQKSGCRAVPHGMMDAISLFAKLRQKGFVDTLKVGDKFDLNIYHADKHFKMSSVYLGKETIKTKIGKKECYVISPTIDESKLVSDADALKFYVSADEDRIPVIMELKLTIGKVSGEVISYTKYDANGNVVK
ncbi:MAG: DUF3108 domain-containing protein [Bacteroidales bacterium]